MAEFPALPLWTDALIGDTFHLTPAEFGAYMRLLVCAWRTQECALPDDDAILGRMIGDPKNWHRLKHTVLSFFSKGSDGFLRQKRLSDERDFVSRCAERSSAGGLAKSLKRKNRGYAKRVPNECQTAAPTPTPTISNTIVLDMPKRKSKRSIPDIFPLQADKDWAIAFWLKRGRVDLCNGLEDEVSKFRDHHAAKLTSSADWPASWRTWTQNAVKFSNGGHNGRSQKPTAHDNFIEGARLVVEAFTRESELGGGSDGDPGEIGTPLLAARLHG